MKSIFSRMTPEQVVLKSGYEIVEVLPDDENQPAKYRWETYSREGNIFDTYEEAMDDAIEDCNYLED